MEISNGQNKNSQTYRARPEPGQLVEVRRRQWVVAEVASSQLPSTSAQQNAVTLSSIDEDGLGEELEVIWEIEPGAQIIERAGLPSITGQDDSDTLEAFLDAVRWGAATNADRGFRTGHVRIVLDEEFNGALIGKDGKPVGRMRWEAFPEEHKEVARRRCAYVKATINLCRSRNVVKPVIAEIAKSIGDQDPPSFSSVMEWINIYVRGGRDIASLAPRYHRRGRKSDALDEVTQIVDAQIEDHYLTPERNTLRETLERAAALVARKNRERPVGDSQLPIPSYRFLRTRLAKHSPYDICCARYGKEYAARKYQTVLGYTRADAPLERVEIDHTVLDLMVIDHQRGLPLGRPTLTVAVDVCTRSVMGYNIGFEPPSYLAVSRCLNHALLPKTYLKDRYPAIKETWDCYGAMEYLVVDNGLEFHTEALEDAAERFGITVQYCPRAMPWFKGTIERFIGTMNRGVAHGKPGTTFENIFERADYDPTKTAVITLEVLEETRSNRSP